MDFMNMDRFLLEFIKGNIIVLTLIFSILKILAKETTWSGDDAIVDMFLNMVRPKKKAAK